jgi:site-specific DNA-methyltransferase (adenine-specific)
VLTFPQKIIKGPASNHPWPKPLELFKFLVCRWTQGGDTILDPFMGSGTTLVAAAKEGRNAIGIDISEEYCQIAKRRVDEALMQPRLL